MPTDEKLILGQTAAELHAGWAEDAAQEHGQATAELTSWLQYLSLEEIRGLTAAAKTAAKQEIARRQGAQNA